MQYANVCSGECRYCNWLGHSQPPTHRVMQPITDISHLILSMCISARQNMLANQKLRVYNTHIIPNWSSSPMEGTNLGFAPHNAYWLTTKLVYPTGIHVFAWIQNLGDFHQKMCYKCIIFVIHVVFLVYYTCKFGLCLV